VHQEKVFRAVCVVLRLGPVMVRQVAVVLSENGIRVRFGGIAVDFVNFLLRLSHVRVMVRRLLQVVQ
jgi:hypothetical protein